MVVSPDASRIRFGHSLRQHREHAGLTQAQLAKAALISQTMLSALERGSKTTRRTHIANIDQVVTTTGSLLQLWDSLFSPNGLSTYFRDVAELEQEATQIKQYQLALIPGLLQTEAYARTLTRIGLPEYTDTEVDTHVVARLQRQGILEKERAPLCLVVLDEAVLHRPIGGCAIMRKQLEHLLAVSSWPRVTIQVVPLSTEHHPGLDGGFKLITAPKGGEILYTETYMSGSPVTEAGVVGDYVRIFGELRGASLPVKASRALIEQALGAMTND